MGRLDDVNARKLGIRIVAPLSLVAALLLAGCSYLSPVATLNKYDPADGIGADLGDVLLRNVVTVTNADGSLASVTFTMINQGEATKLNYSIPTQSGTVEDWIPVAPGSTLVGEQAPHLIVVEGPDAVAGGLLPVTFQAGDADSMTLLTPVLDNQGRPYLDSLVP